MPSCLGLYIENNLIKYAKMTKDRDDVKIDSFGMKFYDKLEDAIKQVIEETYSYKTPISVNLSGETYNYFRMFNLLSKKDLENAIKTEFESLCTEKGYNKNAIETRYAIVESITDKEKLKVIHVSANKTEIGNILKQLEGNRVSTISTMPICITNLLGGEEKDNVAIINIEEKTTITTIINQKIESIDVLEEGSKEFLDKINLKENSLAKAYNKCKETTIYTSAGKELIEEVGTEYLEDIMPTLYNIVSKARKIINEKISDIKKIYITGTGAVINNIDLYFDEYFTDIKCEILKPYFITTTKAKINIKDYVEVNSAIGLALQGLGLGLSGMNFKKETLQDKLPEWATITGVPKNEKKDKNGKKDKKSIDFSFDLKTPLDKTETGLLRFATGIFVFVLIFMALSKTLTMQMESKEKEVDEVISHSQSQIRIAQSDNTKINSKITTYKEMISSINSINNEMSDRYQYRDAIPNLLNQIMYNIPKTVQIISIENTNARHIKIIAQAEQYEQLGFFLGQLKNEQILNDITSDQGIKEKNIVKMTIEGELP